MNRPRRLGGLVVAELVAVVYGVPLAARGEGTAELPAVADVLVPDCPAAALGARALLAALALELNHEGIRRINLVRTPRPDAVFSIEVTLECQPGTEQVRLRVRHAPERETGRTMAIADLPRRLRARAVALAAAELARSLQLDAPAARADAASPAEDGAPTDATPTPAPAAPAAKAPPHAAAVPPAALVPHATATPSPPQQRGWRGLAVGPAGRWWLPAGSAALGGRAGVRLGRWQAGADVLFSNDAWGTSATKLGLAVGWVASDALAYERGRWRLSTGLRVAAGVGSSRASTTSQDVPLGAPVPALPEATVTAQGARGFYVEGAPIVEVATRTPSGWRFAVELALGLGWGITPHREGDQPRLRANLGAGLQAGHGF